MCVDFQIQNKIIIKNRYPLPSVDSWLTNSRMEDALQSWI
jgi:hypothetical protein